MRASFNLFWLLNYISIASIAANMITPALPQIQFDYTLSNGSVEWVMSIFLIGYLFGQLIYGPLANQWGRVKALRAGLYIYLLGTLMCLLSFYTHSYVFFLVGRLMSALGAASGLACTFMLINEWLPLSQKKTAMSYTVLSFALGIGISVLIGGLITQYFHWQICFWILLAHGLLMLFGTCIFTETLTQPQKINIQSIVKNYSLALCSSKLFSFSLVVGSCSAISYCFSTAGPQIAEEFLHLSAAQYGLWNGLNIIGMLIGGLGVKPLLVRYAPSQVIALGFLGIAFGLLNLFFIWLLGTPSALWFFSTSASLYCFSALLFSGGSLIASNAIEDKASAAAMMSFLNMGFASLCVIIMGYLTHNALINFILILGLIWFFSVGLIVRKNRLEHV